MTVKKVIKNGIIKYVRVKEEDQPEEAVDHKDLEIKRLEALVELLGDKIEQLETNKPNEEKEPAPSSEDMAIAPASSYSTYS
jgi:hypothetical protein